MQKDSSPDKDKQIIKVAIQGTKNILDLMGFNSKIIFPSTHVIFDGLNKTCLELNEDSTPLPKLAYSKSKLQNERDIISSGKKYVILRLGSVYGYSSDATRMNIMPNLFSKITSFNGTIKLFSAGRQFKSLVSLIDVARCFKYMADQENIFNEIFHLSKENVTVKEVARICKKINPKVSIKETNDQIPNLGYTLSNKKLLKYGFNFLYDLKTNISEMINKWSEQNIKYDLEYTYIGSKEFIDKRGKISNFELTEPINLIGYIYSKKNTVRANHYHPIQEQKCLVIKGQFISVTKNLLDKDKRIETRVINQGEMVVTKPNVAHAMLFTKNTILLNLVRGEREHENYGITHTIPHIIIDEKLKKNLLTTYKFNCRCCNGFNLRRILSLGLHPLANNLIKNKKAKINKFPLELNYCIDCYNVQLSCSVSSDLMFKKYFYLSSTSKTFRKHFALAAKKYISQFKILKNENILDVGSNDGIGLVPFQKLGFKNLFGFEPAKNLAKITNKLKIKTYNDYLNLDTIKKVNKKFKLILASNVFAHTDDIVSMTLGIKRLLKNNGVLVIEVQYLLRTIEDLSFDNIYHEHFNYWSLTCLIKFFNKFGLFIFNAELIDTHGGSLRVYVSKKYLKNKNSKNLKRILIKEQKFGIDKFKTFEEFSKKVNKLKNNFELNFLKIEKTFKNIAFYGSPAKATTKLNFYNIEPGKYTTFEDNNLKIGKFIPGVNIKICSKNTFKQNSFDVIIVLAWNFFNEIRENNSNLSNNFLNILDLEKKLI